MRTYEIHASAKQVQRTTGRSSVAASAYRSASLIYDHRTGITHDYRNKQGVEHSALLTPDNAPSWAQDRTKLWNAAEEKENRVNSMTAREWVIAFPREFNIFQRREAGDAIARERVDRLNTAVEISYHKPDKSIDKDTGEINDNQNHHAHIMFPTRGFDSETKDGWSKNKYRYYSHDKIEIDGKKIKSSEHEINQMRLFAAAQMNKIAQRDGLAVKTEHLSFEERGIDRQPTEHLGHVASDMKKKGKESLRENINIKIRASNDNRAKLEDQKNVIQFDYERQLRALDKEEKVQKNQAQQIKDNLQARNKVIGFLTGKTQQDQKELDSLQATIKAKEATHQQQKKVEAQLKTTLQENQKEKIIQKKHNDNLKPKSLNETQGELSQKYKIVTASPEQIEKNIKAQAHYKPEQQQNSFMDNLSPEQQQNSFMDNLSPEQKAKIEAYKQENPEQDNKEKQNKKQKQDYSQKPALD